MELLNFLKQVPLAGIYRLCIWTSVAHLFLIQITSVSYI